jgi:hypothetical protein
VASAKVFCDPKTSFPARFEKNNFFTTDVKVFKAALWIRIHPDKKLFA